MASPPSLRLVHPTTHGRSLAEPLAQPYAPQHYPAEAIDHPLGSSPQTFLPPLPSTLDSSVSLGSAAAETVVDSQTSAVLGLVDQLKAQIAVLRSQSQDNDAIMSMVETLKDRIATLSLSTRLPSETPPTQSPLSPDIVVGATLGTIAPPIVIKSPLHHLLDGRDDGISPPPYLEKSSAVESSLSPKAQEKPAQAQLDDQTNRIPVPASHSPQPDSLNVLVASGIALPSVYHFPSAGVVDAGPWSAGLPQSAPIPYSSPNGLLMERTLSGTGFSAKPAPTLNSAPTNQYRPNLQYLGPIPPSVSSQHRAKLMIGDTYAPTIASTSPEPRDDHTSGRSYDPRENVTLEGLISNLSESHAQWGYVDRYLPTGASPAVSPRPKSWISHMCVLDRSTLTLYLFAHPPTTTSDPPIAVLPDLGIDTPIRSDENGVVAILDERTGTTWVLRGTAMKGLGGVEYDQPARRWAAALVECVVEGKARIAMAQRSNDGRAAEGAAQPQSRHHNGHQGAANNQLLPLRIQTLLAAQQTQPKPQQKSKYLHEENQQNPAAAPPPYCQLPPTSHPTNSGYTQMLRPIFRTQLNELPANTTTPLSPLSPVNSSLTSDAPSSPHVTQQTGTALSRNMPEAEMRSQLQHFLLTEAGSSAVYNATLEAHLQPLEARPVDPADRFLGPTAQPSYQYFSPNATVELGQAHPAPARLPSSQHQHQIVPGNSHGDASSVVSSTARSTLEDSVPQRGVSSGPISLGTESPRSSGSSSSSSSTSLPPASVSRTSGFFTSKRSVSSSRNKGKEREIHRKPRDPEKEAVIARNLEGFGIM
ncbi:hypothetical protein DFJ73DRAFT_858773 [Zopfochytrium polystomum]|nr:hypothetical protein DFJ73DRAFT_858773 [Zopfochytrium polystomum]